MSETGVRLLAIALGAVAVSTAQAGQAAGAASKPGAALFAAHCAVCHGVTGAGTPALAPPLTRYPARYARIGDGRRQLAMTVLYGMIGQVTVDGKRFNFQMPQFSQLDDATLADVLNYVIFGIAKAAAQTRPISPQDIASERLRPADGQAVRRHRAAVLAELGLQG